MLRLKLRGEGTPAPPGIKLESLSLLDLAPGSITGDATVQGIIGALDPQLRHAARNIANVLIYSRINELPEPVIDTLAWQWHVDFYEPDLPLETKRELVLNSIPWHRINGTPAAVERMVTAVFGSSWLTEWFEADPHRRPYTFRLSVDLDDRMPDMDAAALANLRRIVECTKNTRSYMELIELLFHLEDEENTSDAFSRLCGNMGYEDIYPYPMKTPPGDYDGRFLYGGASRYDGRFIYDGTADYSGVMPGYALYGGSVIQIDDLHLSFRTSFYDDVSEWSFTPEWGGHDGIFTYDGLLSYAGMPARWNGAYKYDGTLSVNEYTRNVFALPVDWSMGATPLYKAEDNPESDDANGTVEISCVASYNGAGRMDGRAVYGAVSGFDPLDGVLSVPRPSMRGFYEMDGSAVVAHDALPIAV